MEVGVARIDITPENPVRISGYAARDKAETDKVLHRLSAKALAFGSDEQNPSLFITVDLLGIPWRITQRLMKRLSAITGIKPSQIVIAASHTHGGPEVGPLFNHLQCRGDYPAQYNFSDSLLALDQLIHIAEFNEALSEKLEEMALAALENRKPSLVSWGTGEVSFAVNRRTEGGPVDRSMPLMRITDIDGTLRAILINYACHGITLGPEVNEIHGDWMGEAQKAIEARYPGVTALVSIGCAGDAHPVKQGKQEYLNVYSEEIAVQVDNLLNRDLRPLDSPPLGAMEWVQLPFAKIPTVRELIALATDTTIHGYYARLALERIQRGDELPQVLNYPIQIWNFGDQLVMINMGGEVVVDYAIRLKRELGADRLWINAYSNDASCYIASKRVIKEGGYEVDDSMYWYDKPSRLSEEVEEVIVEAIRELILDN
ncbi:hypothetical protein [Sphingobacterium chuzhouense]|uniref:Neutral/alkaline non-lysosomal ceramidase N-terminal domain-containing protein n=1 Tax=Sphingobacterium chuzhouense TaxID=1742264 RepID=A0ABR7XP05_9SPHI|nr:hypothetical protein [Sphingobacterium chuzhouense]MBD1420891.1 hypothetical protein [Sphingobacterium chuzhouense]